MAKRSRIQRLATVAALTAGWISSAADAAPLLKPVSRTRAGSAASRSSSQMIDIALGEDRTLRGRFVDTAGEPIDGAVVTLKQGERLVARSTTLEDGTFLIERVPAGSYRLSCGSAAGQIRCWPSEAAPPNAVVDGVTFQDNVVRGQAIAVAPALLGTSAMTTAAASGMAIGGVATYAAAESSSASNSRIIEEPPLPPAAPPQDALYVGQMVGRDAQGNLVRIHGTAPWESSKGPLNSGEPPVVVLPVNVTTPVDPPFWPASP